MPELNTIALMSEKSSQELAKCIHLHELERLECPAFLPATHEALYAYFDAGNVIIARLGEALSAPLLNLPMSMCLASVCVDRATQEALLELCFPPVPGGQAIREGRRNWVLDDFKLSLTSAGSYTCNSCKCNCQDSPRWLKREQKDSEALCSRCWKLQRMDHACLLLTLSEISQVGMILAMARGYGAVTEGFEDIWKLSNEIIGQGHHTEINRAVKSSSRPLHSDEPFESVVKILLPGCTSAMVYNEILMASAVQQHPNILRIHGVFNMSATHGNSWGLVQAYCNGGDLFDWVRSEVPTESRAREIILCVFRALEHVHSKGVVHRDVKAENVLLDGQGQIYLADFGIAAFEADREAMQQKRGSPGYIAPELLLNEFIVCSFPMDIFSCGPLLYYLLSARLPFGGGANLGSTFRRTVSCVLDFLPADVFDAVSNDTKILLKKLTKRKTAERPSAAFLRLLLEGRLPADSLQTQASPVIEVLNKRGRKTLHAIPERGRNTLPSTPEQDLSTKHQVEVAASSCTAPCMATAKELALGPGLKPSKSASEAPVAAAAVAVTHAEDDLTRMYGTTLEEVLAAAEERPVKPRRPQRAPPAPKTIVAQRDAAPEIGVSARSSNPQLGEHSLGGGSRRRSN